MSDLYLGDCREVRSVLADNSIDTIITDPPYGLEFMGKGWDKGVPGVEFWKEFLAVAKPGAMLLAFGGTRTFHRMTCAIEDAGWEIRDCLMWLYGSGFPKSLDISKAIDKAKDAENVVGSKPDRWTGRGNSLNFSTDRPQIECKVTAPASDLAREWSGWGTALKPAWEPIIVAMKPLDGTFAENAEKWGAAGINVDGGRIASGGNVANTSPSHSTPQAGWDRPWRHNDESSNKTAAAKVAGNIKAKEIGRWPANLLLDEDAAAMLDGQSGDRPSSHNQVASVSSNGFTGHGQYNGIGRNDSGGASRFFKNIQESDAEWLDQNLIPGLASSVESRISLQNESVVSALKLAVTRALPEDSRLSVSALPSTPVTPKELRQIVMSSTEAIPYFVQKFSQEPLLESATVKTGPVKVVAAREQIDTMTITVSHWRLDGSADPAIFSTTLPLVARGEAASRFNYCAKASKSERNRGCEEVLTWERPDQNLLMESIVQHSRDISEDTVTALSAWSTALSGNELSVPYSRDLIFITSTALKLITALKTCDSSQGSTINVFIRAALSSLAESGPSPAASVELLETLKRDSTDEKTASVLGASLVVLQMLSAISASANRGNCHSTVKPLKLMEYLCTLTKTPTGGIVLDPFSGSGTTLLAAKNTGREYVGIEQNPEYFEIIKARLGMK